MPFIVKNTTFPSLLDLLAPHTCRGCERLGNPLCEECKNYIISCHQDYCPFCKKPKTSLVCPNCRRPYQTFVLDTRDHLPGTLIHDLKYNSVRALARPLAELLNETLPKISGEIVIVPLPTISRHIRERGLDHTLLIAKHLAHLRGKNYRVEQLLLRSENTVQVGSDSKTRLEQASKAYAVNPNVKLSKNTTYLLLDDVWTTGASMQSAAQKISSAGAKKILLTALTLNRLD